MESNSTKFFNNASIIFVLCSTQLLNAQKVDSIKTVDVSQSTSQIVRKPPNQLASLGRQTLPSLTILHSEHLLENTMAYAYQRRNSLLKIVWSVFLHHRGN